MGFGNLNSVPILSSWIDRKKYNTHNVRFTNWNRNKCYLFSFLQRKEIAMTRVPHNQLNYWNYKFKFTKYQKSLNYQLCNCELELWAIQYTLTAKKIWQLISAMSYILCSHFIHKPSSFNCNLLFSIFSIATSNTKNILLSILTFSPACP